MFPSGRSFFVERKARYAPVQMFLAGDDTLGERAEDCELPTAMASRHLRLMQRCGFLTSEKKGRKVYYRVADPHLKNILQCIKDQFDTAATRR